METAKLFRNGRSQAVRLPKEFRFEGDRVYVKRVTVKNRLGKLPLPEPAERYLPRQREGHGIASLSLDEPSVARLGSLTSLHRDPFDRMLVCQALHHGLVIATSDDAVHRYPVEVM